MGLADHDLLSDVASRPVIDKMKSQAEKLAEKLREYTVKKPAVSTVRRMLDKLESELAKDNKIFLVRWLDDMTKWAIQRRSARL